MKTIKKTIQELTVNMKNTSKLIIMIAVMTFGFNQTNAQIEKLAGPRAGITVVTPGSSADFLNEGLNFDQDKKYGSTGAAFTTQFGWQWESRFGNGDGGIVGLVEWVALVGGLEKGKFLPSISAIVGARTDKGLEFGVGPNLSLTGVGLVFGAGKNFSFGNLNVPVNVAFIPGVKKQGSIFTTDANFITTEEKYTYSTGSRISVIIGFNMKKDKKVSKKIN